MSANNSTASLLPNWDPFAQSVTLLMPDGTPFNISMTDMDIYRSYGIRICINYSSQIGASFMLLVVLLLLTKRDKRRSPIFILNTLCLLVNTIRSLLQCLYFTGPFYYPYAYFAQDYSKVPQSEVATSVAADALTLMLVIMIMISLILQIRVVCITTRKVQRFWIMIVAVTVAMVAIAFRFALVVINCKAIITIENFSSWMWLVTANTAVQAISIWFFCVIFTVKLGFALKQRRKLGMRQFGPMQIIFIMGCQTMVIPAIFTVFQYIGSVPELVTQTLTMVAIFLPLSAIWAGTVVDKQKTAARGPDAHHKPPSSYNSSSSKGTNSFMSASRLSTGVSTRISHSPMPSPTCAEMEGSSKGIQISKQFAVSKEAESV